MTDNLKQCMKHIAQYQLSEYMQKLQKEKNLSIFDLDEILTNVLSNIKSEKELLYSDNIVNLTYHIQQLEEEKKKLMQDQSMQVAEESKKGE